MYALLLSTSERVTPDKIICQSKNKKYIKQKIFLVFNIHLGQESFPRTGRTIQDNSLGRFDTHLLIVLRVCKGELHTLLDFLDLCIQSYEKKKMYKENKNWIQIKSKVVGTLTTRKLWQSEKIQHHGLGLSSDVSTLCQPLNVLNWVCPVYYELDCCPVKG